MNIIKVVPTPQYWAYPADISAVFGRKSPTKILRSFKEFCDSNPNYFKPAKPYIEYEGAKAQYNFYCFAHYFEHKNLLDTGARSIKFSDDLQRLIEAYSLHLLREGVF